MGRKRGKPKAKVVQPVNTDPGAMKTPIFTLTEGSRLNQRRLVYSRVTGKLLLTYYADTNRYTGHNGGIRDGSASWEQARELAVAAVRVAG